MSIINLILGFFQRVFTHPRSILARELTDLSPDDFEIVDRKGYKYGSVWLYGGKLILRSGCKINYWIWVDCTQGGKATISMRPVGAMSFYTLTGMECLKLALWQFKAIGNEPQTDQELILGALISTYIRGL